MAHLPVLLTPYVLSVVLFVGDDIDKTKIVVRVRDPCLVISKRPVHFVHVLQCFVIVFTKPNFIAMIAVTVAIIVYKSV